MLVGAFYKPSDSVGRLEGSAAVLPSLLTELKPTFTVETSTLDDRRSTTSHRRLYSILSDPSAPFSIDIAGPCHTNANQRANAHHNSPR